MRTLTAALIGALLAAGAAQAPEGSALGLALNTAGPSQLGFTLTLVLSNGLAQGCAQLVTATVR